MSFTIQLHNLRFFACHGVFEEEQLAGNEFEVNISLKIKSPKGKTVSIEDTINYAEVYEVVREIFSVRTALLETLAMEMAGALKKKFPSIKKLQIQLIKLHPPITSFSGSISVTYNQSFK
jgi:7,8-dihydroneopterin aldolase/epimerase/oxygenase